MDKQEFAANHFIQSIIEEDLRRDGQPGLKTRFPPEPNGYLHIGHAKSICLNFGMAYIYGGQCNLRFDDTNPEKESNEYVAAIEEDIKWLGFSWNGAVKFASDYFSRLFTYAEILIQKNLAYVDDLTTEDMKTFRGTLLAPGVNSPWRGRTAAENLDLFHRMKNGEFAEGSKTLRLKIDMSSPNLNLRDPIIYRIRRISHQRTGTEWCIYPLYDFTHCLSDAIEGITHSLCTLEFEDHRPLYDWILDKLEITNRPHQYEFSRLELLYTVTSKRKLNQLVASGAVAGWDDPRLPTIAGMRRRGYTPAGIRLFCKRAGISKSANVVDFNVLEGAIRDDLEHSAPRMMAVLRPLKVELINYDEVKTQSRFAPFHPQNPDLGAREVKISAVIYIEHDDFSLTPPPKWQRLTLGGEVRLRHSYIIRCEEVIKDAAGAVTGLKCRIDHDTLGKKPEGRKVKGVIHWVSAQYGLDAEVRLYERLFTDPRPDTVKGEDGTAADFCQFLNPHSVSKVTAKIEPCGGNLPQEVNRQFERLGYFITDRYDHKPQSPVFNRTVTLRDHWQQD